MLNVVTSHVGKISHFEVTKLDTCVDTLGVHLVLSLVKSYSFTREFSYGRGLPLSRLNIVVSSQNGPKLGVHLS